MAVRHDPETRTEGPAVRQLRRNNRWLTIAVIVLTVALVAVGGWLSYELTSEPSPSAEQGAFPTGTFVGETYSSHAFEFFADGTFTYAEGDYTEGDPDVSGIYGIRDDLYTEMVHDYAGYDKIPATYRWTFDGERLTFELVGEDVLYSREQSMTGQTYIKSG